MMPSKLYVLLILFLLLSSPALGHEDTRLALNNQKLVGLPEQYQPALLNLNEKWLQIGKNRRDLSDCLTSHFLSDNQTVTIDASWYHDFSLLPPYFILTISPKGKDYRFKLMFNLETLQPMKFEIAIQGPEQTVTSHELVIKNCGD